MKITDSLLRKLISEELYRFRIIEPTGVIREEDYDPTETSQDYKVTLAIESFQRLYRHLDPDTRYFFTRWLENALIQNLSVDKAVKLTSKISAASKGNSEPKQPNKK